MTDKKEVDVELQVLKINAMILFFYIQKVCIYLGVLLLIGSAHGWLIASCVTVGLYLGLGFTERYLSGYKRAKSMVQLLGYMLKNPEQFGAKKEDKEENK